MNIETLTENVCESCPATQWGKSRTCSAKSLYIGAVTSCVEWDKYMMRESGVTESGGQLQLVQMTNDPALLKLAKRLIDEYAYYMREIERIAGMESDDDDIGVGVARYGLQATLPSGKGKTGDRVFDEVSRRLQNSRQAKRYRGYVERLQKARERVWDTLSDKHRTVLDMLMKADDMTKIGKQIGVSRQWAYQYKEAVVMHIAGALGEVDGK